MYFLLFFSTILLINSSNINLCKRCKFYISTPLSKCKLFLRNKYITNTIDYEYCFLAREIENMCGKTGKRFAEKDVVEKNDVEKDVVEKSNDNEINHDNKNNIESILSSLFE
jgi:hypothetical protein